MYKQLRGPERLFRLGQWAVALLFAYFLTQVGASLIADLPSLSAAPDYETFLDQAGVAKLERAADEARKKIELLDKELAAQRDALATARRDYERGKESFDNWMETRRSTARSEQDPEIVARARQLDQQLHRQQDIDAGIQKTEKEKDAVQAALRANRDTVVKLREEANASYTKAVYWNSLKAFSIRLLFVGPVLILGIVAFRKYRKSPHWPFAWGFILFALFAFFFELVPYLPSFGGYIRYGVGALLTFLGGRVLMRSLQQYLERKRQEQAAPQEARKQDIRYEKALEAIAKNQCPSCERATPGTDGSVNFCMHCGLRLFKNCPHCGLRHNAFFMFCPACGANAEPHAAAPAAPAAPRTEPV